MSEGRQLSVRIVGLESGAWREAGQAGAQGVASCFLQWVVWLHWRFLSRDLG